MNRTKKINMQMYIKLESSTFFSQFRSVAQSCPTLQPHEPQHARPPCPSPTAGVHPNSCPSSGWCHPGISSSVIPFSSCLPSFPTSGALPKSWLLTSVLPMNTQDWFPLGWTGWISLQPKGLSRVFSNTSLKALILWLSAFFTVNPHIHSNHSFDYTNFSFLFFSQLFVRPP